ncbi:MAG: efflux RND transporter periplasmic adaptor subunit [Myxococcales bacterium]|nr:efflux RND transporter periplasmic adaptor subunit [Myxococcales bacterium]MCB9713155.1 efflux RND transporter periplasmic adaptor subunit [Myxococcales bacterium]
MRAIGVWSAVVVASALLVGGAWWARTRADDGAAGSATAAAGRPTPVEVAPVQRRALQQRRTLTGTLEAAAAFVVAPKVGGRVERIAVDLGDPVQRGQVVAELDDAELRQAEAEAQAELAVAEARRTAADKSLEIAERNFTRVRGLSERGMASDQELDTVRAAKLEGEAAVAVAKAQVTRARAALRAAQVRRAYTRVVAEWPQGDEQRVVAARFADEGATLDANDPLLSIVDLDEVVVVVFATERDYAALAPGQAVELSTDAYPGERFEGRVERIAPVFSEQSRQARVELRAPNPDGRLRPGMFVRASTVLAELSQATVVPEDALVQRDGETVVFVVSPDGSTVSQRPVSVGIRDGDVVAVEGEGIEGRVVTLGQQALHDGAPIVIPAEPGSGAET